jgi:hypothetical protein
MVDVVDDAQLTSGKSIRLPYRGLSIIRPSPLARNVEEEKALHEKNCMYQRAIRGHRSLLLSPRKDGGLKRP